MFICAAILALLFQATDTTNPKVWIDNNEVWITAASGSRQLTRDGVEKRLPQLSPDGNRIVYVVVRPGPQGDVPSQEIVEIDANGMVVRRITLKVYVPGLFDRLDWIDNRRIGAMTCGHANCFYWIEDADTGETLKTMEGGFDFIWSHDGRWVARRTVAEGEPGGELDVLLINDADIYPSADDEDRKAFATPPLHLLPHAHSFGPFAWSPHDVWLAFTDSQSADEVYVVLVSPSGVTVRTKLPTPVKFDTPVEWTDDADVQLTSGIRTFKFRIIGSELQQVAQ